MNVKELNGGVLISNSDIDLYKTFDCGQCFRFEALGDGVFKGVAFGRVLDIKATEAGSFYIADMSIAEFESRFALFFDLERDYEGIRKDLLSLGVIPKAIENGGGIHILRQEFWETLCSFIISQNNNIPRIKKIIASLCRLLGDEIAEGVYTFPSAEKVAQAGVEGLAPIKAGFRAKYMVDAAEKVASGALCYETLCTIGLDKAIEALCTVKGVGRKVAGCVALFSLGYMSSFPVDVWIKRVLDKYYAEDFNPQSFGSFAGLAQQYLFYNERYLN